MIIEIPKAITSEQCQRIREAVRPFLTHSEQNTYNRDGKTVNISKILELKELDDFLLQLFIRVQENVILQRYKPPTECTFADSGYEYHFYDANEVCHFHSDTEFSNTTQETLLRYASVTLHLNTVHNGGELVFPAQNKKVKTEEGKIVIFPPYGMFGHYTTPSEEPREVVVTWFVYKNMIVRRV
jgi:predicted 2-oxoglutarate/Fe(II)-dependent dioxygenase YbiX